MKLDIMDVFGWVLVVSASILSIGLSLALVYATFRLVTT